MLSIPTALQTKLSSGATTLARAWIVRRSDGAVQASPITTAIFPSMA